MTRKTKIMRKTTSSRKTIILIALGIVVLAIGGWLVYSSLRPDNSTPNTPGLTGVNLNPATEQEKQEANQRKEELAAQEEAFKNQQNNPPATTKKAVTPVIVDAGQYDGKIEARAYVPGIVEDGGTCTFAFTNGPSKVTKTSTAERDATTTRCTNIAVNQSEFPSKGDWSLVVTYTSSTAQGNSQVKTFKVQ